MLEAIFRLHNLCVDAGVDWSLRAETEAREAAGLVRGADGRWCAMDGRTGAAVYGTEVDSAAHAEAARRGAGTAAAGRRVPSSDAGSRSHRAVVPAASRREAIAVALGRAGKVRPPVGS
jgi:hypothetical protein